MLLTAYLVQTGFGGVQAARRRRPAEDARAPGDARTHPGRSRVGGLPLVIYRNSLSLALLPDLRLSFVGHLLGGTAEYNEEQALQSGAPPIGVWEFLRTSDFWFQSMQNWQSEFLAVGCADPAEHRPAPARLARVEAGDRRARQHRRLSGGGRRRRQAATGSRLAKQMLYGLPTYSP